MPCPYLRRLLPLVVLAATLSALPYVARAGDVMMQPDVHGLPPIVVTPSAYTVLEAAVAPHGLQVLNARDLPLIDNDIMRTVHPLPGVISTDFSGSRRI